MPFVNPEGQTTTTDVRKIFIGRVNELMFFEKSILRPEKPTHNIISVSGDGGVGKSALLAQFIDKTYAPEFKDYCLIAHVDEQQNKPASIMEKIASQLHIANYPMINFEKMLLIYKKIIRREELDREALLRNRISENITLSADDLSNEEENANTKKISRIIDDQSFNEYSYHQRIIDSERLDDPIGELTRSFVEDLNQIANTPVALNSHPVRRQRRIILFFDPFDQLASELVPWFLDHLLKTDISTNVVLVIAGHDPIERASPKYLRRWLPIRDNNVIYPISLNSFTEEETYNYLTAQGITEQNRITRIWELSSGLPLFLSLVASNSSGEIDPTNDVIDAFLGGISEDEEVKQRLALDAALFSMPFNQDDLEAFTYITDDDRPILFRWLTGLTFVHSNLQDGRFSYHNLAQQLFSRHLYQSPKKCQTTRRALAEHYQRLLEKTPVLRSKGKSSSYKWLELNLALIKQLFLLDDDGDHINAVEQVLRAYELTSSEQDEDIVKLLRELSQEHTNNQASADARQTASRLLQFIEAFVMRKHQEFLSTSSYLLDKAARKPSFPTELLASIYTKRASLNAFLKNYKQAIEEINLSVKIDAKYSKAYVIRGQIYGDLERYNDALIDFNCAIKFDPDDSIALLGRGKSYRDLGCYEEALQDLEHAVELNSDLEHMGSEEIGIVYHSLQMYQDAIDYFLKALKSDSACSRSWRSLAKTYKAIKLRDEIPQLLQQVPISKSNRASIIACRAEALSDLSYYEEALADFTHAIELKPNDANIRIKRGRAFSKLNRLEEALADFTRAIELKPNNASFFNNRGVIYHNLYRYDEALHHANRSTAFGSLREGILFESIYSEIEKYL